jgi:hypothetical protein
MTIRRKDEARFLSKDEGDLVERTHQPELASLSDEDLTQLRNLLRERRDRAGDIARRQRREMRGKAARPQGTAPATDDAGSKQKVALLAQAMKRVNSETARRNKKAKRSELVSNMQRALAMKQAAGRPSRPSSRTARKGMKANPNQKAEQIADPREVGRVSQFVKQGQAKRDR